MIQFTTVTLLYSFASSLGDFQYVQIRVNASQAYGTGFCTSIYSSSSPSLSLVS